MTNDSYKLKLKILTSNISPNYSTTLNISQVLRFFLRFCHACHTRRWMCKCKSTSWRRAK